MQCMGLKVKYSRNEDAYVYKSGAVAPFVRLLFASAGSMERIGHVGSLVRSRENRDDAFDHHPFAARIISSLTLGNPYVPKLPLSNAFRKHRESLAVYKYRTQILSLVNQNKFCVIKGPAGCGKSTQIPQYILEDAEARRQPVRILSCLPESVAVLSVSDRVAMERGERMGYTVGYQITLESSSSPVDSLLIFLTAPVLLRGMTIPGCRLLDTTTHIIIDEIHCRLQSQDFLLACLRDTVISNPHLKIIFMGEDVNINFISEYLEVISNCPELMIEVGEKPPVKTFYLGDIIRFSWESTNGIQYMHQMNFTTDYAQQNRNANDGNVDGLIEKVFRRTDMEESFGDFVFLYRSGDIDINYTHSQSTMTMLMVSCTSGRLDFVETLLKHGANPHLTSTNGFSAIDWAKWKNFERIVSYLNQYSEELDDPRTLLLEDYIRHTDPSRVDLHLVARLINFIHVTDTTKGGILVFLPDYEELCELQSLISSKYKNDMDWGYEPLKNYFVHKNDSNVVTQPWKYDGNWISQAEANQRKSRAGLYCGGGVCYRLYTEQSFKEMRDFIIPEMAYCSLSVFCLLARALLRSEVPVSVLFRQLPTPPEAGRVEEAVEFLKLTGAMDKNELLTELGIHLMDYNIEPAWAKAVLYSVIFKCLDPILTIAACMSYGNQFLSQTHPRKRESFYAQKEKLSSGTQSDHMALLKAFHKWESERAMRDSENLETFCGENCISPWNFEVVYEIRSRLLGQLRASGFVHNKGLFDVKSLNKFSDNYSLVRAVLVASLYPNVCVANRVTQTWFDRNTKEMGLSKSSVLSRQPDFWDDLCTDWMIFNEKKVKAGTSCKTTINWCTLVNPLAVALLAGDMYSKPVVTELRVAPLVGGTGFVFRESDRSQCSAEMEKVCLNIDDWIRLFSFNMDLIDIIPFRGFIHEMIIHRLRQPQNYPTKVDERVLKSLVDILTEQDLKLGLKQASVGQWPKLVSGNLLSVPGT
ncbi:unnamed protein product, partial [Allacma fusca]